MFKPGLYLFLLVGGTLLNVSINWHKISLKQLQLTVDAPWAARDMYMYLEYVQNDDY